MALQQSLTLVSLSEQERRCILLMTQLFDMALDDEPPDEGADAQLDAELASILDVPVDEIEGPVAIATLTNIFHSIRDKLGA